MRFLALFSLAVCAISSAHAGPGPLVSTEWLAAHLNDSKVRIVAVDDVLAPVYPQSHIPGAIGLVLQTDLESSTRRDFIGVGPLETLAGSLGIGNEHTIVFYDSGGIPVGGLASVYAYWIFYYRGASNIAVLDGGLQKWTSESRPITTDVPRYPKAKLSLSGTRNDVRTFRDSILQALPKRRLRLIDARTREEFVGKAAAPPGKSQDIVTVTGHIPGARHVLWSRALRSNGTFLPAEQLRSLYGSLASSAGRPVASYCLRGERGVVTWFVLHELLQQKEASLYDGSWTEWGNLVGVPVAR